MTYIELINTAKNLCGGTQESLASKTGYTQGAVSKWERDESRPDLNAVVAIFFACKQKISLKEIVFAVSRPQAKDKAA